VRGKAEKKALQAAADSKRKQKAVDRKRREELKSKPELTKEAQASFNKYIRHRDAGRPCASCGSMPEQKYGGTVDCSHFRSVGSAPHLRFNVFNAVSACVKCNRYLSGNIVELRKGLIRRFGLAKVEEIENDATIKNYTRDDLRRIKRIFDRKTKILTRLRGWYNSFG
jgi:hypothetical protein